MPNFLPQTDAAPLGHLWHMTRAFWSSPRRNALLACAAGLVAVIGATAYCQVRLNAWNQPFYDALTRRDTGGFWAQLRVFAGLAGGLLLLNVAQTWLNQMSRLKLRQGMVEFLFDNWLQPLRAFRLSYAGSIGVNPDQRMSADAQHLADLTTDLGVGLIQSGLLLASFIGVLWGLSAGLFMPIGPYVFAPPGYLVWCALIYVGCASALSWAVGRPLIALNATRYAREADFRFDLVRVSEGAEAIAMYGGEAAERARLGTSFGAVYAILRQSVGAMTRLTWVTAGSGWLNLVVPILVAAPAFFAGQMSFGELMAIIGAFNQTQAALRWFVDNFAAIADWGATLSRVSGFARAMGQMDQLGQDAGRIAFAVDGDRVTLTDLSVTGQGGVVTLGSGTVTLRAGERVLITGADGEGQRVFFWALAGLWPWGAGRVVLPPRGRVMFIPSRAYLPTGTLRDCVTYPHPGHHFTDDAIAAALRDVGLERLATTLDKSHRWERHLSENEQHCLGVARILLQRPDWVIIDDALTAIEAETRHQIETIFATRLATTGVINIGHDSDPPGFYTRRLALTATAPAK